MRKGAPLSPQKDYLSRLRAGEPLKNTELSAMILKLSLPSIMAQISTIIMQYMNLHPHAVLSRVLWRWYQNASGL